MLEVVVDIVSDLNLEEILVACVSETETQFKKELVQGGLIKLSNKILFPTWGVRRHGMS